MILQRRGLRNRRVVRMTERTFAPDSVLLSEKQMWNSKRDHEYVVGIIP